MTVVAQGLNIYELYKRPAYEVAVEILRRLESYEHTDVHVPYKYSVNAEYWLSNAVDIRVYGYFALRKISILIRTRDALMLDIDAYDDGTVEYSIHSLNDCNCDCNCGE